MFYNLKKNRRQAMLATTDLAHLRSRQIILIIAGHAALDQMLKMIASVALQEQVRVMDGGNQFNVYLVARVIRRLTAQLNQALKNIHVSRSFNCYQMTALLEDAGVVPRAVFILDFLSSFYDEDVSLEESQRLLRRSIRSVKRLSRQATIFISARPSAHDPSRQVLLDMLKDAATLVWEGEPPSEEAWRNRKLLPLLDDNA
jgi:hypothetical protein